MISAPKKFKMKAFPRRLCGDFTLKRARGQRKLKDVQQMSPKVHEDQTLSQDDESEHVDNIRQTVTLPLSWRPKRSQIEPEMSQRQNPRSPLIPPYPPSTSVLLPESVPPTPTASTAPIGTCTSPQASVTASPSLNERLRTLRLSDLPGMSSDTCCEVQSILHDLEHEKASTFPLRSNSHQEATPGISRTESHIETNRVCQVTICPFPIPSQLANPVDLY